APEGAPGWVLQAVEPRRAVFAGPEGEVALELRVFDGVGGQAPTPFNPPAATDGPAVDPMAPSSSAATVVADPSMAPQDPAGAQGPGAEAGPVDPMAEAVDSAAHEQAAQEQVQAIRRRIEERRARLRADETAAPRPGNPPDNQ